MRALKPALVVLLVAGLSGAAPKTTAYALDGESCQGQPATIVSTDGFAEGTEGDDVIVADGAVQGLGGDDLICVVGRLQAGTDEPPAIDGGAGTDSVTLRASQNNDQVDIYDVEQLHARMSMGFDVIRLFGTPGTGTIDGGRLEGGIAAYGYESVSIDLKNKFLVLDGGAGRYKLTRFDNARATAQTVKLVGDAGGNKLTAAACVSTLSGGRGNDLLQARVLDDLPCTPKGARIFGLEGKDRMYGTSMDDVLLGGADHDIAIAGPGVDRCVAEKRMGCER